MASIDKLKQEVDELAKQGEELLNTISLNPNIEYHTKYQTWYSLSSRLISRVLPERLDEFKECYSVTAIDPLHRYPMSNFLNNLAPANVELSMALENYKLTLMRQLSMLKSLAPCLASHLLEIRSEIYYEYQDDELDAASEVMKINLRAAGAIAGVVLEKHLKKMLSDHNLVVKRSISPGIQEMIEILKQEGYISPTQWKRLDYLREIRNTCDHNKKNEPSQDEVKELVDGTRWAVSTLI